MLAKVKRHLCKACNRLILIMIVDTSFLPDNIRFSLLKKRTQNGVVCHNDVYYTTVLQNVINKIIHWTAFTAENGNCFDMKWTIYLFRWLVIFFSRLEFFLHSSQMKRMNLPFFFLETFFCNFLLLWFASVQTRTVAKLRFFSYV